MSLENTVCFVLSKQTRKEQFPSSLNLQKTNRGDGWGGEVCTMETHRALAGVSDNLSCLLETLVDPYGKLGLVA